MPRITKAEAKARGLSRYFTGKPCRRGHVVERWVANGGCATCKAAIDRAWGECNKPRKAATMRAWQQRNKEHHAAITRAWRERNKPRKAATTRAWRAANPDQHKANKNASRARKRQAPGRYRAADIARLRQRQGDRCAAPHCRVDLAGKGTVDHKKPLARGGSNWPRNLQLLCAPCNSSKRDRTMAEWLASRRHRR